jgi:hypothetical protein
MFLLSSPIEAVSKCHEVIPTIWQWHPPVGVFIGLLTIPAVLVPWFRGEKVGRTERAFWTLLICLFVSLEIRTIYLDQAQHDRDQALARCQQLESFRGIADTLNVAISDSSTQFTSTMSNIGKILTKQDTTLTQTMGGKLYPLFLATFPPDPKSMDMPVMVITPGHSWPHGHIPTSEETAPLADLTVDLTEQPTHVEEMTASDMESVMHPTHYNLGTIAVPVRFTAPFKLHKGRRYTLQITTRRGEFREDIYIDRDANAVSGWKESWCMYGRQTIYKKNGVVTSEERLLDGKCD